MVGGYNAVVAYSTQGQARAMFSILMVVFLKRLSQDSKLTVLPKNLSFNSKQVARVSSDNPSSLTRIMF